MTRTLALFATALGLLLLSGATWLARSAQLEPSSPARPVALVLLVDRSASMDGGGLRAARRAALAATRELGPRDRVGLVSFAADERTELPLRSGLRVAERIKAAFAPLRPAGSTDLAGGLASALRQLHRAPAGLERRILVLTDPSSRADRSDQIMVDGLRRLAEGRGVAVEFADLAAAARPALATGAAGTERGTRR